MAQRFAGVFKDQRRASDRDLLTVTDEFHDKANIANETSAAAPPRRFRHHLFFSVTS